MIYKQILQEIKQSSTDEYYQAIKEYYKDDSVLNMIIASESQLRMFIPLSSIQTEKTEDDNLIIRYYEDEDQIIILGMISKLGHINKSELIELKVWLGRLKDRMKEGTPVISSLNHLSEPIFNRIVTQLEQEGYSVEKTIFNNTIIAGIEWITYMYEVNEL